MATYVVGFEEETDKDYWRSLRQRLTYDPDQIQLLYVTPHHWTPYCEMAADRRVIQMDLAKWDYKHQVLATRHMAPWRVLTWVKFIEAVMQFRPRALRRLYAHPDLAFRDAMRWYYQIGRQVWPYEIRNFIFRDRRQRHGLTPAEFWDLHYSPKARDRRAFRHTLVQPVISMDAGATWNALFPPAQQQALSPTHQPFYSRRLSQHVTHARQYTIMILAPPW